MPTSYRGCSGSAPNRAGRTRLQRLGHVCRGPMTTARALLYALYWPRLNGARSPYLTVSGPGMPRAVVAVSEGLHSSSTGHKCEGEKSRRQRPGIETQVFVFQLLEQLSNFIVEARSVAVAGSCSANTFDWLVPHDWFVSRPPTTENSWKKKALIGKIKIPAPYPAHNRKPIQLQQKTFTFPIPRRHRHHVTRPQQNAYGLVVKMAKEKPTKTGLAVGINKGHKVRGRVPRLTSWRVSARSSNSFGG